MKKFISGLVVGTIITSIVGVFAVNSIYENPYPIFVNGEQKQIQGYNVDDYSYFKLRDIADAVGGFTVDFQNDAIQIAKDGYSNETATATVPETAIQDFTLSESDIFTLSEYCQRIPAFNQSTVGTKEFADNFIFYYYTGTPTDMTRVDGDRYYGWEKSAVRKQFKELFGVDMYDTDTNLDNGYYWVHVSNFGEERYVYLATAYNSTELIPMFKRTDSSGANLGTVKCHVIPANNSAGYIITAID